MYSGIQDEISGRKNINSKEIHNKQEEIYGDTQKYK